MSSPSVEVLFPTLLQRFNLEPHQELIDKCYEVYNKEKFGVYRNQRSNRLGFQSAPQVIDELKPVRDYIDEHTITTELIHGRAWININPLRGYHIQHTHPNSDYACVYYLTDSPSKIVLTHPHQFEQFNHQVSIKDDAAKQYGVNMSESMRIVPKKGDILLFPAYVPHYVDSNTVSRDRISISWNIDTQVCRGKRGKRMWGVDP